MDFSLFAPLLPAAAILAPRENEDLVRVKVAMEKMVRDNREISSYFLTSTIPNTRVRPANGDWRINGPGKVWIIESTDA